MTGTPSWFATEVLRRLSGVKRGKEPGQFYARCPAHDDKHASLAIKAGDDMPLIYWCHAVPRCDQADIRAALAGLGVPEEYLGQYGTPEYEQRRQVRGASGDRRDLEAARRELADLKAAVASLLHEQMTPAMLSISIQAAIEGIKVPSDSTGRKEFIALAVRAGVSKTRRYEAWAQVCSDAGPECVPGNHVVLTHQSESCQPVQRKTAVRFPETGKAVPERENGQNGTSQVGAPPPSSPESRNGKTVKPDMAEAIETLHKHGLTGRPAA